MMTGSMVSDPRQSYLKNRLARWGDPAHVEPRTLYLNEIDPPPISRCKTNPIILMSNTERCYSTPQSASPEGFHVGSARRHPQKPS